jgi:serine protease Do
LDVWRDGRRQTVNVTLGTQPESQQVAAVDPAGPCTRAGSHRSGQAWLFSAPAEEGDGVEIADLEGGSPAAERGLREGDVVLQISGMPVNSPRMSAMLSRPSKRTAVTPLWCWCAPQRGTTYVAIPLKNNG